MHDAEAWWCGMEEGGVPSLPRRSGRGAGGLAGSYAAAWPLLWLVLLWASHPCFVGWDFLAHGEFLRRDAGGSVSCLGRWGCSALRGRGAVLGYALSFLSVSCGISAAFSALRLCGGALFLIFVVHPRAVTGRLVRLPVARL